MKQRKWILAFLLSAGAWDIHAANVELAIIGDAGKTTNSSKVVRESILRAGVSRLILPGDNLYSGTYESVWSPWKRAGMTFDVTAIGNHNDGYRKEMAFFSMPGEYYSKVIENSRFIVLNSDNNSTGAAQSSWLDRELSSAQEHNIFIVYHHPSYTISSVHRWEEKRDFQLGLRPVIWAHRSKITALIVGHDHLASFLHFGDLPIILSGAVHEQRSDRPIDYSADGIRIKTAWYFDRNPYWARLTVKDSSDVVVDYVRGSDDKISCTVVLRTGEAGKLDRNCSQ